MTHFDFKAGPATWTDVLTAALVGVGILQLLAFVWQAFSLRATFRAMRATDERQKSTDRTQLRAWIGIESIILDAPNLHVAGYISTDHKVIGARPTDKLVIRLKNFGQTPANRVLAWARPIAMPAHERLPADYHRRPFQGTAQTKVRQQWSRPTIFQNQVSDNDLTLADISFFRQAVSGEKSVYLYGGITYVDVFGKDGSMEFCYSYDPTGPVGRQFVPYEDWNEAK
jgi:hypothetical protein